MSTFSIAQADLTPSPIPSADYTELTADVTSIADVVTKAEALFVSWLGGTPTESANLAICKPQVVQLVVWYLHYQFAQNGDYEIPEPIQALYKSVERWATSTGQAMLAAEGTVEQPGAPSVSYVEITARYTRDKMDLL